MTMLPCSKLIKANTIQTQVSDLGARALAISLPFACVLGLLSSMIASTMGRIFSSNLLSSLYYLSDYVMYVSSVCLSLSMFILVG